MSSKIFNYNSPIGNPTLWLKADKGVTVVDGKVSLWEDQSGNGYNVIQENQSYKPTYFQNGLNNKPYIYFDGVNKHLQVSGITINTPLTIFSVMKIFTTLDDGTFFNLSDSSTHLIDNYGGMRIFNGSGGGTVYPSTPNHYIMSLIENGSASNVKLNNTKYNLPTLGSTSINRIDIGFRGVQYSSEMDLYEFMIFNSALTDSQRQSVENYLKIKYAIV